MSFLISFFFPFFFYCWGLWQTASSGQISLIVLLFFFFFLLDECFSFSFLFCWGLWGGDSWGNGGHVFLCVLLRYGSRFMNTRQLVWYRHNHSFLKCLYSWKFLSTCRVSVCLSVIYKCLLFFLFQSFHLPCLNWLFFSS